jgi:sRNA-binding carbon storage regulator CsrA
METITCSEGEALIIDGEVMIYIVEVGDDEVCLKIDAPDGVQVRLGEFAGASDSFTQRGVVRQGVL